MEAKHIIALEIGSSKIKGAVGVYDDDILTVTAIEEEKLVDSVRHGVIINVATVASRLKGIIRKLENRVSPYKARSVYVGIGGRSFLSSPRTIERQLPTEEHITQSLINQLRDEALSTAIVDREVITVADGEYAVDHHQVPNPVGVYGRHISAKFNLITCRPQVMKNLRRVVVDNLGLKINGTFVRQIAEGELVLSNDERRQGCMLVDFGAETTTVSIYRNGALCYMATLPMGSRNITRDIMTIQPLEEHAESLKLAGGNAMAPADKQIVDGVDFSEINSYVAARALEIVANVNEQIRYAGLTAAQLPGGIIITGNGARLKGLKELLEKITKIKKVHVGLPSPLVRIADSRISPNESVDVISTLFAAVNLPDGPVNCMVNNTPAEPKPEPKPAEPQPAVPSKEDEERAFREKLEAGNMEDADPEPARRRARTPGIFKKVITTVNRILSDEGADEEDDE